MPPVQQITAHFTRAELECNCGCGLLALHPGFGAELERLRLTLAEPMVINSACRCALRNAAIGGHPRSLHVADHPFHAGQDGCLAVDVAATDGRYRGRLFVVAWELGWSVGWNAKRGFLHLDRRDWIGLPQTTFDY